MHSNEQSNAQKPIYSVSQLNRSVKQTLEGQFGMVWVEGEVSNLKKPASGHIYFSLKDGHSQIRCMCFKQHQRRFDVPITDGSQLLVYAKISVYEPRGDYQLMVQAIQHAGEGALQRAFEVLKKQLAAEGLFDESLKRLLPKMPQRVGVITSATGAALKDVLRVLNRRFPAIEVIVYPSLVQGAQAPDNLCHALAQANLRNECDVLLMVRGGGSLEDLWAFNNENLSRAISKSQLPVVTGIGHQVDFTIADFVSDFRAATPSAAAECVSPSQLDVRREIQSQCLVLYRLIEAKYQALAYLLNQLRARLRHPVAYFQSLSVKALHLNQQLTQLMQIRFQTSLNHLIRISAKVSAYSIRIKIEALVQRLDNMHCRLDRSIAFCLAERSSRFNAFLAAWRALNPSLVLQRGYTWVKRGDTLLTCANQVSKGDQIQIEFKDGVIDAKVN